MPFNPFAQNPTPPVDSDGGTIPDRMADDGRSGSQAVDDTLQSGVPDDDWSAVWADNRPEQASAESASIPADDTRDEGMPAATADDGWSVGNPDRPDETSNDGGWGGMWDGEEDDEPPSQSNGDFGWNAQTPVEHAEPGPGPAADDSGKAARNPPRPSHDWRDDISTETTAVPAFDWNVDENTTDWERDAEAEEHKPFPWRVVAVAALTLTVLCASGFGAAWLVRHQAAQQAYDASCDALATTGGKWRRLLKEAKALDVDTSELSSPDLTCAADADGTDAKTVKANGMVKKLSASVDAALDGKWEAFKKEAAKHPDLDTSALTETKPKTAADLDLLERRLKDMVDKAAKQKADEEQKKAAEEQKKANEERQKAEEEQRKATEEQQRAAEQSQNATEQTPSYTPPTQTYTPPVQTYTPPARTYTPPARPSAPSGNSDADM